MATFIMLMNFTQDGVAGIKDSPNRRKQAEDLAEKCGVNIVANYLTMGSYDRVGIVEAPDGEAVARFALALGGLGFLSTTTPPGRSMRTRPRPSSVPCRSPGGKCGLAGKKAVPLETGDRLLFSLEPAAQPRALRSAKVFSGSGPGRVVRVDIGRPDDAGAVDHQPRRYGQRPAVVAIGSRQVEAETLVNRLHLVRHLELDAELGRHSRCRRR